MQCSFDRCDAKAYVLDSTQRLKDKVVVRYRRCELGHRWVTWEVPREFYLEDQRELVRLRALEQGLALLGVPRRS